MFRTVISLTSYPIRINKVHYVIESLFKQKEKADEIVLWLSVLEFPNKEKDLPKELICLIGSNGFRIAWVRGNIKSHKKYFYALQDEKSIVITVDDDMYYSEEMVGTLLDSYRKHPHSISARNVHIITREKDCVSPYLLWESDVTEYIDVERMDLCAIGVNGVLYPPGCRTESWFNLDDIMKYAKNQDDLWLKFNEIIEGIPTVYTGMNGYDRVIEETQVNALYIQNAYGGDNDMCIKQLTKRLKSDYRIQYQQWYESLMEMKEFLLKKRNYYKSKLGNVLEKWNAEKIYICGAGRYAHIMFEFIKTCGKENHISAFLVSQKESGETERDIMPIRYVDDLCKQEAFAVICGVGEKYREELREALEPYELHEWIDMDVGGIARLLQLEETYLSKSY